MRRFEFVDGKSNKFWEAKTEGPKLMVRFGRIGVPGRKVISCLLMLKKPMQRWRN